MGSAHEATHPPLDVLKPMAEDVWIVDSGPLNAMGLRIPVRMAVVRLRSGETWLHSPTRFSAELKAEIEELGPIRHLVAPNVAHWQFLKDWQAAVPEAETWAVPGLRRRPAARSRLRSDHDLGPEAPAAWREEIEQVLVRGGFGVSEAAFLHLPSRTLLLTDLVQNMEAEKLGPLERRILGAAGSVAPNGRAPLHLRLAMRANRSEAQAAARRLVEMRPERVIFAHGLWFDRDAPAALARSLRWLTE